MGAAGELSVRVFDSMLGMRPKLWEFTGKTGTDEEAWQQVNLTIGARKHRFQVRLQYPQNSSAFFTKNTFSLEEYKVYVIYFSCHCLLEIEIEPYGGRGGGGSENSN